jgi:putative DNA mismatch endonuclease
MPGRNSEWWQWKIAKNQARDRDTDEKLEALGWMVIHIWEHDDVNTSVKIVTKALQAPTVLPPEFPPFSTDS